MKSAMNNLSDYMLTKDHFKRYISSLVIQDISSTNNFKKNDNVYYLVKEDDSLFWSFYILKYGLDHYMLNKGKGFDIVQQIKINAIESMKKNSEDMKLYKLKKTEIEKNLLYDKQINKASFFYLCLCYSLNVIIIENQVYYECIGDDTIDSPIHMIKLQKHHYVIYKRVEKDYQDNYFKISNVSKPLLAIGSYKVNELQTMCTKLKIQVPANAKKKDMYEEIVKHL